MTRHAPSFAPLSAPDAPGALFCTALLGADPAHGGACRRSRRAGTALPGPAPARWERSIGMLRAWGQQARALRLAEHALARPGLDADSTAQLHYLSALCLDALGRSREAATHYAKAIDHALAAG